MAEGRIGRVKPGDEPKLIYVKPGSTEKIQDWMFGPGNSMRNYDEMMRPLAPGELSHARGGKIKAGSSTRPAMCKGGKVISSRSM
jgi:hypothetical protein